MKITKKLLEQYIREVIGEANFTQLELPMNLPPKATTEPQAPPTPPAASSASNPVRELLNSYIREHMKDQYLQSLDLGPRELFRLYMLNPKWNNALNDYSDSVDLRDLPKITNVTKMQSGITDVEYSNGDVQSHQPRGVDVNQMYVRRGRWR